MSFLSDVLDSIPVVGQVKGIVHYATGDTEAGNRSMYRSNRTTAVLGAGAVGGIIGGPAGALAFGAGAGTLTDGVVSVATDEPQGVIKNICDIGTEISHGDIPVRSTINTAITVGMDAIGGYGMGGIASSAAQKTAETVSKTAVTKVLQQKAANAGTAYYMYHTATSSKGESRPSSQNNDESAPSQSSQNSGNNPNTNPSGEDHSCGSGSDPPKQHNKEERQVDPTTSFSEFLEWLKSLIENLRASNPNYSSQFDRILNMLKKISIGQQDYLMKIIRRLQKNRCLAQVMKIGIIVLSQHFERNINFPDFLSFVEFVAAYILEEADNINSSNSAQSTRSLDERLRTIIEGIANNPQTIENIANEYLRIEKEIERDVNRNGPLHPDFRNMPAAVYHFFKHRQIPGSQDFFSVEEYYDTIRKLLNRIKELEQYRRLQSGSSREAIVYEVYWVKYRRRIRVVIKVQGGNITLSSAFVVDNEFEGDKDGDVFINGKRLS